MDVSFVNFNQITSRTPLSENSQLKNLLSFRVEKKAYLFNHLRKASLDALNSQSLKTNFHALLQDSKAEHNIRDVV